MPSSHLPRAPCDKFVDDFPCDFFGHRRWLRATAYMCSHCLRASCDFFSGASGATRGKSVQRLCGDCMEIVQCQYSCRAVSAASARKSYRARAGIGLRTVPVRGLCNATYDMSTGLQFFKFVKLLAKPNRRGCGARESCLRREASWRPHGKGDTGSVDPSHAKCESFLGITDLSDKRVSNKTENN